MWLHRNTGRTAQFIVDGDHADEYGSPHSRRAKAVEYAVEYATEHDTDAVEHAAQLHAVQLDRTA